MGRDLQSVWHPFVQRLTDPDPLPIVRGEGTYLYTEEGEKYLDAISSWWVTLHGHAHPKIAEAIGRQAKTLEQVIFTDFTHPGAVSVAEELLELLPEHFTKVFFTDNGSTAVEVALKMALQWWKNRKIERKTVVTFRGGYHGDTFGTMSMAGKNSFNTPFWSYLFEVQQIDPPFPGREEVSLNQLKEIMEKDRVAAFLFEPLIQGATGMRIYSQEGLETLLGVLRADGAFLIADEVMTGFGRTGPLFVSSHLKVTPDILALSKGITGGFLPLGATVTTERIYDAFLSSRREEALLHGHSYTANPLACAATLASLSLLREKSCQQKREWIGKAHKAFCKKLEGTSRLKRIESLGTILVAEFAGDGGYFSTLRKSLISHFMKHKIIVRPLGNVLYFMPPYCIEEEDLAHLYQTLESFL
ncbi:MAG: Adenosylmethionine-8-amino-7-oxononanoate aminotransferase [Chlamydiae bacterium]|nr:Adenosylmethionine-8-amino-7-oxononanoate aminotransferase [Chlamydiota bacterium]